MRLSGNHFPKELPALAWTAKSSEHSGRDSIVTLRKGSHVTKIHWRAQPKATAPATETSKAFPLWPYQQNI
jgi:hypothetical protein